MKDVSVAHPAPSRAAGESDHTLRQMLDAVPAAVYTTDADGRLTYFNRAAVEFSGRVPEIGTDQWCVSWKLYYPDGTPMRHDECPMAVALKEGRPVRGTEAIAERPDGRRILFRPFPTPLRDASGRITGGINVLVDLTEARESAAALRASEERYRRLMALLPAAVYTCEAPSGMVTYYNDKAAELWGRVPRLGDRDERFCGSFRLWYPDGTALPHDQTPMAMAMQDGRAFRNVDVVIERPDGSRISVLVNIDPIRDDTGAIVGAINVFHDTSALKEAELELLRRTNQLSMFLETAAIGLHRVGPDGVILWANDAELQMLGYARDEYVGHNIAEFHADQDLIADILARLHRGEKVREYEARVKCKDGSVKIVLIDSSVLWDGDQFVHTQCFTRDITERKLADEALKEANRRKDEFLATLAHELRNPLAPLQQGLEIMRLSRGNGTVVEQARSRMERQLGHLVRLVDDLLDVGRITRGKVELKKERVELATILEDAVEACRPLMEQAGHELRVTLPDEPVYLSADVTRLAQVFANLLNNAAKFTDRGGQIRLVAQRNAANVTISVRDNGMGIAPEFLPQVFEMFAQADHSLERPRSGLGIGLTLVKGLVELHGGTVEVRSDGPGKGSEVLVRLPISQPAVATDDVEQDGGRTGDSAPLRMLVVDDQPDNANALKELLELLGHEAHALHDGLEAVNAAAAFRPDVIFLDIAMPKLNGYEAAQRIREQPWSKRMTLVALTGWGESQHKARSQAAGFDFHLTKPMSIARLESLLASVSAAQAARVVK
ncbi:MAG TPA: PAS domain S-box protein [Gemmatimonadales bacterium]|nr:PAS domain S-box protein [Gemmatimonadales bacterium]